MPSSSRHDPRHPTRECGSKTTMPQGRSEVVKQTNNFGPQTVERAPRLPASSTMRSPRIKTISPTSPCEARNKLTIVSGMGCKSGRVTADTDTRALA
ncbi:hypothetical protein EMEDMD4_1310044 [Sinorhizobium medicae]|uniref:Uncharacterized protein n=1 Tax=Sinorhizobium medicae TaxID=110321 RepID=A0A508WRD1_9HYPH|nr:hypothetical protein EMEDMD4_1310044 [Sinorhizobium medicae]